MTSIAVLGAAGQLGSDLVPTLQRRGWQVHAWTHADADLTQPESLAVACDRVRPDYVVNCAAYNLVDRAEMEPDAAMAINALGVRNLARVCRERQLPLLHISTDHVFGLPARNLQTCHAVAKLLSAEPSPTPRPWMEHDTAVPVSVYGVSKLAGEAFVRALVPQHCIVRTCGLYGQRATRGKGNFVETMVRLASERPELRVVGDQTCCPTSTADLAGWLAILIETGTTGVVHAVNSGACTWADFAREILRQAGIATPVRSITTAEFAAAAARPTYSVLAVTRLQGLLGVAPRPWQLALADYLAAR